MERGTVASAIFYNFTAGAAETARRTAMEISADKTEFSVSFNEAAALAAGAARRSERNGRAA